MEIRAELLHQIEKAAFDMTCWSHIYVARAATALWAWEKLDGFGLGEHEAKLRSLSSIMFELLARDAEELTRKANAYDKLRAEEIRLRMDAL